MHDGRTWHNARTQDVNMNNASGIAGGGEGVESFWYCEISSFETAFTTVAVCVTENNHYILRRRVEFFFQTLFLCRLFTDFLKTATRRRFVGNRKRVF